MNIDVNYLTTSEQLLGALDEACRTATTIDIAVAWAGFGGGLERVIAAATRGARVRVVVGKDFDHTHPDAVAALLEASSGCTRWGAARGGLTFHPKVYLFEDGATRTIIIGSPNLTNAAFAGNVETAVRLTQPREAPIELAPWFETLWAGAEVITVDSLAEYARHWNAEEEGEPDEEEYEARRGQDLAVVQSVLGGITTWTWDEYVVALDRVNEIWKRYGIHVFGDQSWLAGIEELRPLILRSLGSLRDEQRRGLFGDDATQSAYLSCAHLGRLNAYGTARHLMEGTAGDSRAAQDQVTTALAPLGAIGGARPTIEQCRAAYDGMRDLIGPAATTRYLALRRPDCFVSMNAASRALLGQRFNVPKTTLGTWKGYGALLAALWRSPWMNAPRPSPGREERIWIARAALVDAFVYQPTRWSHPSPEELDGAD